MQRPTTGSNPPIPRPDPGDGRIVGCNWQSIRGDWSVECLGCAETFHISEEHLRVVMRVDAETAGTPGAWFPDLLFHDGACLGAWVEHDRV